MRKSDPEEHPKNEYLFPEHLLSVSILLNVTETEVRKTHWLQKAHSLEGKIGKYVFGYSSSQYKPWQLPNLGNLM